MQIPESKTLPTNLLSACFNNTSATYKFYWLLSLVQSVESNKSKIDKKELFARMISNAWYTVNYFHVSFGKQDLIQKTIYSIKEIENISIELKREQVFQKLLFSTKENTLKHLNHFNKNVPHWFLSPWFPKQKNETDSKQEKRIYALSQIYSEDCLYGLFDEYIVINPKWQLYLLSNARLIKDFCYWNLALFLQIKNPNVPDIPNKLIKPGIRNSLLDQRNKFWNIVLEKIGSVKCIYTGNELKVGNYAVEHFIPYNFVSHDLIWNLIPADKSFNSSKSDKLPNLEKYFNPFFDLQKIAVSIIKEVNPKNKYLEDYLTIFPDSDGEFTIQKYKEIIQPLITIASNNGFEYLL